MSSRPSPERLRFLHEVASLYHLEGRTQSEIAQALSTSRTTVLRALQEARQEGIVRITVVDPSESDEMLARSLERRLGLSHAIVVAGHPLDPEFTRRRVGHAAARHLDATLPDDASLGLGWGRTLYEVTQALESDRRRSLRVVPLTGGLGQISPSFQVHEMARVCSERLGGTWTPFFLPAIVGTREAYETLMASPDAAYVAARWSSLDVVVVGIGNVDLEREVEMLFAGYVDDGVRDRLRAQGVVGDLCMRFIRLDGQGADDPFEHVVSISLDQLRQVPRRIAVACGSAKAPAILGAIRGGYVDTLITDSAAAREVVRLSEERT